MASPHSSRNPGTPCEALVSALLQCSCHFCWRLSMPRMLLCSLLTGSPAHSLENCESIDSLLSSFPVALCQMTHSRLSACALWDGWSPRQMLCGIWRTEGESVMVIHSAGLDVGPQMLTEHWTPRKQADLHLFSTTTGWWFVFLAIEFFFCPTLHLYFDFLKHKYFWCLLCYIWDHWPLPWLGWSHFRGILS